VFTGRPALRTKVLLARPCKCLWWSARCWACEALGQSAALPACGYEHDFAEAIARLCTLNRFASTLATNATTDQAEPQRRRRPPAMEAILRELANEAGPKDVKIRTIAFYLP